MDRLTAPSATPPASLPRSRWLTLPAPLLAALLAVLMWLSLAPAQVMHVMREGGPIEGMTEILYFVLAAALWLSPLAVGERRTTLALSVILAAAGAREMDLHKHWTGTSVLKVSFYLRDAPLHQKIIAFVILALIAAAAIHLLRQHGKALWLRLKAREPVACSIALFFITMVISKVLDRSINVLAEDFGISSSASVLALVSALEETVELALPVMAGLARWQYLRLRNA